MDLYVIDEKSGLYPEQKSGEQRPQDFINV